jgi:hypothetical protein
VGGTGLEHDEKSSGKTRVVSTGGAESGAVGARQAPADSDLLAVIAAWPKLPAKVKAGILAMMRAAGISTDAGQ